MKSLLFPHQSPRPPRRTLFSQHRHHHEPQKLLLYESHQHPPSHPSHLQTSAAQNLQTQHGKHPMASANPKTPWHWDATPLQRFTPLHSTSILRACNPRVQCLLCNFSEAPGLRLYCCETSQLLIPPPSDTTNSTSSQTSEIGA